jgi:hypothetical protein
MRAEETVLVEVVDIPKGNKERFKLLKSPELWDFYNKD